MEMFPEAGDKKFLFRISVYNLVFWVLLGVALAQAGIYAGEHLSYWVILFIFLVHQILEVARHGARECAGCQLRDELMDEGFRKFKEEIRKDLEYGPHRHGLN